MTTSQVLLTAWTWEPSVLVGCAALLGAYVWAVRGRLTGRSITFLSGVLLLALALLSPIDTLGDHYLFSAHMLQHLLLVLAVPPLLIMGIPAGLYEKALHKGRVSRTERILSNPLLALFLSTVTLWVWHIPALYDGALRNEELHIFQHMTFLVTSAIFWWPVVTPVCERRMNGIASMVYLVAAGGASTVLGILLTFLPAGVYPYYLNPPDVLGILPLIRQQWGLTPQVDQAGGGLIMWVPGGLLYLGAILGTMARWYAEPEDDEIEPEPAEALSTVTTS
jgi:cytochrome c oxidase assembly factor CtaG